MSCTTKVKVNNQERSGSGESETTIASRLINVSNIIELDLPEHLKNLADNVNNLENVAQYCEDIYVNSTLANKSYLFNQTKGYTTQALASIAYQVKCLNFILKLV